MERIVPWTGSPIPFPSSCFICRSLPFGEVLSGSRKGAFSVPSMVSRVQAFVDFTHGSSASTEYRCSVTGYVLVYGLFPYGYMIFGYVSAVAVTWLLLRPSLSGGGCLPLRSSAVRCRPGHGNCRIPDRSIPGR